MRWLALIGGAALALACGMSQSAYAQTDELEVTLEVLDDLTGVDGFRLAIEEEAADGDEDGDGRRDEDDLDRELGDALEDELDDGAADEDEESEAALEDHDVATDAADEQGVAGDDAADDNGGDAEE